MKLTGDFLSEHFSLFRLNVFLCIWYLFDQISARVFLINLFFYASFYCIPKVHRNKTDYPQNTEGWGGGEGGGA